MTEEKRAAKIGAAYRKLGRRSSFYDGVITCSSPLGKLVNRVVWAAGPEENRRYLAKALSGVPADFCGRLLDVPAGTGVLTLPLYRRLPGARIDVLDYSEEMLAAARRRAERLGVGNVAFHRGDVGALPFGDGSFDVVLSLNGFHVFPDKEAAWRETRRVLKPGGTFCGAFYVKGQVKRADWFAARLYVRKGYFTPPFETVESLRSRLGSLYAEASVEAVGALACFVCRRPLP